jgi:hypothetical protein
VTDLAEKLLATIDAADTDGVLALLAPLTEAERAALEPHVTRRAGELHRINEQRHSWAFGPEEREESRRIWECLVLAHVAWLGTGAPDTWPQQVGDVFDNDGRGRRHNLEWAVSTEAGHRVLADRRPVWLPDLVDEFIDHGYGLWYWAWRFVVAGLVARPASTAYLHGLAAYSGSSRTAQLEDMVARDSALIEVDLANLLALPDGLAVLARGQSSPPRGVWSPVLAALPTGHPCREQILSGTVDALGGDVGRDAAIYHQLLTALKPTVAELTAHRRGLLRLAAHRVPAVVGVAVKLLGQVQRAGHLDPADALDGLGPASGATAVGTARTAIGLIGAALRKRPDLAASAATALAGALTHPRADVQLDAVRILLPHADDARVAAVLADARPDLAPTVAAHLDGQLSPGGDAPPDVPPERDLADLLVEAAGASSTVDGRPAEDLTAAVAATRAGVEPPPVVIRPWRDARPGADPVVPVAGLDELIESVLQVIDRSYASTSTMERALDGLAALGQQRPADFGRRVGPIAARIKRIDHGVFWDSSIPFDFCLLVDDWIELGRVPGEGPLETPRDWLVRRIHEVRVMLKRRTPARLLALPTDEADWIDPLVLADRTIAADDVALTRPVDVAVAVARLAPWGRRGALDRLRDVPGPLAAAVRAACGSDEDLAGVPDLVRRAIVWQVGQPHPGPPYRFGAPEAPPPPRVDNFDSAAAYADAERVVKDDGSAFLDVRESEAWQAFERWREYVHSTRYSTGWAASQWPSDARWVWESEIHANRALRWLLTPDEPLNARAIEQVVRQATDDSAERRTLVADVLTQLITDGRLASDALAAALRRRPQGAERDTASAHAWPVRTAGRVVDVLTQVAATSSLHRAVVRRALAATVAEWHTLPAKPLHALLALLDQLCTADRQGVADADARKLLAPLAAGRSKTAGLARRVLNQPATGGDWPDEAAAAALAARLNRARLA